ncbi:AMIN domain-containing protein [Celerinatantimonas sp. MCCC 1A17872]|uniref:AMIN domain-containing protein n=1 Tax=Celerinatantimonas sp. MCCC 1A17872 TaxID=3177514 RepID=UPI0038C03F48
MKIVLYRNFYMVFFLFWLLASGSIFLLTIWGDFDNFLFDVQEVVQNTLNKSENETAKLQSDVTPKKIESSILVRDTVRKDVVEHTIDSLALEGAKSDRNYMQSAIDDHKKSSVHNSLGSLNNISFKQGLNDLVTALQMNKPIGLVSSFVISDKKCIVIDVHGKWINRGSRIYSLKKGPVFKVVIGMHPDKLRLVFYLRKSITTVRKTQIDKKGDNLHISISYKR